MKYILKIISTGELKTLARYPRKNYIEPLYNGKKQEVQIYVLIDKTVSFDHNYQRINKTDIELTDELYENLNHLHIAYQKFEVVDFSANEVIKKLNESVGSYMDIEYPQWKRDKHLRALSFDKADNNKKSYYKYLDAWMDDCRQLRDVKENEYLTSNVIPDFDTWPLMPIDDNQ